MKKIANILTDSKQTEFTGNDLYNITSDKEKLIPDLPTLIIGWKKVYEITPNFRILDWKIGENMYWTFSRRERGEKYENCCRDFEKMVLNDIVKRVKYRFVNLLTINVTEKRDFLHKIKSSDSKIIYIENDIVYICFNNEDTVYGISLGDIEYEGKDKKSFLNVIFSSPNAKIVKTKDFLPFNFKISITDAPYLIPWFYW